VASEIVKLLDQYQDKPFFLACGFYRPHTPFVAPKSYFELFPKNKFTLPVVPADHVDKGPAAAFGSAKKEQEKLTDDLRRKALQAYYASTTFMDAQIGVVLQALERLKLSEKTIVVFISDHGYHLGEHGLWQKMSLFENSARVPMIIYDPRAKGNGQACTRTVELVSLHSTLADLCGLKHAGLDGPSFQALVQDPTAKWEHAAYSQVSRGTPTLTGETRPKGANFFMGRSVRTERYRYTEWDDGKKGTQLFDYTTDPGELKNLANDPQHAEIVQQMKVELEKVRAKK
jgi:uncharacterized sulfatase